MNAIAFTREVRAAWARLEGCEVEYKRLILRGRRKCDGASSGNGKAVTQG
jgi:hypothetical protein